MDNKLYLNLKRNLEGKLLKRCFKHYGFISDIFQIINYQDGEIQSENITASATFKLEFSCRLCKPLVNQKIICQINQVNKVLITAANGPIIIIITNDRINDNNFFTDNNNNVRYKNTDGSQILRPKEFIKVSIIAVVFNHGDEKIKAMGFLDSMANDEEIKKYYQDMYINQMDLEETGNENDQLIDYQDYVKSEEIFV
ncbi:DNA-directed RNA polymerase [uncultured virus]|nr:DNA-directed RNA polymerase [uncultured virus]